MSLRERLADGFRSAANVHRPGRRPDIFLFATPRGGSTWLMEILASQPAMKFYDEPLNPRRRNVARTGRFPDFSSLMPDTGDAGAVIAFLRELQAGRHGFMNPTPFRRNHRLLTRRIVFKIHEVEHLIPRIEMECQGTIVVLMRHPIANSISRNMLPRLDLFLESAYYADLLGDPARLAEIRRVARAGGKFQRSIVSWCFENLFALRRPGTRWLNLAYEELVLNPESSAQLLMARLELVDRERLLEAFERPAINIRMSRAQTLEAMRQPDAREKRRRLVAKWQGQVGDRDVEDAAEILALFRIDAYDPRELLPNPRYLHFADTARLA